MLVYPLYAMAIYCDALQRHYGVTLPQIEERLGCSLQELAQAEQIHFPHGAAVRRLVAWLDELDYFARFELAPGAWQAQQAVLPAYSRRVLNGIAGEVLNSRSLESCLLTLAGRLTALAPSHRFWVEKEGEALLLCHRQSAALAYGGPQWWFVWIWQRVSEAFALAQQPLNVTFADGALRDAAGFARRVLCVLQQTGAISSLRFGGRSAELINSRHNPALQEPLRQLVDGYCRAESSAPGTSFAVREILTSRLSAYGRSLDADAVSVLLGMNRRTLHRRLDSEGASFRALRIESRIERAKQLFSTTTLSVADISEAVGFAAVSGFSRSFKAVTGVSPSEYRARQE